MALGRWCGFCGRVVIGLVFLGRGNHVVRDIMGFLGVERFNSWVRTVVGGREVEVYVTEPLATSPLVALSLYYRLARSLGVPGDAVREVLDYAKELAERLVLMH